jgi:hypothetical protein
MNICAVTRISKFEGGLFGNLLMGNNFMDNFFGTRTEGNIVLTYFWGVEGVL